LPAASIPNHLCGFAACRPTELFSFLFAGCCRQILPDPAIRSEVHSSATPDCRAVITCKFCRRKHFRMMNEANRQQKQEQPAIASLPDSSQFSGISN